MEALTTAPHHPLVVSRVAAAATLSEQSALVHSVVKTAPNKSKITVLPHKQAVVSVASDKSEELEEQKNDCLIRQAELALPEGGAKVVPRCVFK